MEFLIALVIGYAFGLFAFSNIVLPLLWAWPKARRLDRERRLTRPIPGALFLVAPLVWSLLVLGSLLLLSSILPAAVGGYVMGLVVSFGQIARLVFSPNADMEADFADSFRAYLE